jgi:hypothetical protein
MVAGGRTHKHPLDSGTAFPGRHTSSRQPSRFAGRSCTIYIIGQISDHSWACFSMHPGQATTRDSAHITEVYMRVQTRTGQFLFQTNC